jgi:ABC-type multidrug transport system permease subunit
MIENRGVGAFRLLFVFRLRTCYRDPAVLFWMFVFPVLAMLALGLAFRPGVPGPFTVGVLGSDARVKAAVASAPELQVRVLADADEADRALGRGEVGLVVVAADPPRYRFDPTRESALIARLLVDRQLLAASGRPPVHVVLEPVDRPGIRYVDFFVPGLIGMQYMNTLLLGVGYSLVEMRARRMLRRFVVTPMPRYQLLLAQLTSRLFLAWIMSAWLLAIGHFVFGVQIRGSLLDVALLVLLGGFAFAGISLAVAARLTSSETALGVVTVISVPMVLFSGVFFSSSGFPFSTSGMPDWIRVPASVLPLTIFNDSLRALVNEGDRLASMPGAVAALAAWGLVPFVIALRTFKWT